MSSCRSMRPTCWTPRPSTSSKYSVIPRQPLEPSRCIGIRVGLCSIGATSSASASSSSMAVFVKRRHGLFSRDHEHGLRTGISVRPNGERDAWGMAATMDHSSIRGLGTALHLFLAGLPRSEIGDHPEGCSLKTFEDSPHRSHASRSPFGVWLEVKVPSDGAPVLVEKDLGAAHFH